MITIVRIIIFCTLYAVFNVSGAVLIKMELKNRTLDGVREYMQFLFTGRVISGFLLIGVSALIIFKGLSSGRFSYVMPVAVGINFILTVAAGAILFGDRLSLLSFLGISLILLGIVFMSMQPAA
ncbi:MAG: hypothetical protein AABZ39_09415 [Spirochaetota bacterium]